MKIQFSTDTDLTKFRKIKEKKIICYKIKKLK